MSVGAAGALLPGVPRRRRVPVPIALSLVVLVPVVACAIFGAAIAPQDPAHQDLLTGLSQPSSAHPLGTDELGRDTLSRTIAGARTALVGPILIALGAGAIGGALGLVAGYRGGWVDAAVMRTVDALYALPSLLIAIVVVGTLGGGYLVSIAVLIVLFTPVVIRLVRGATVEQRPLPYVEAARTLGLPGRNVVFRQIGPNVLPLLAAQTFLNFAFALVTLSGLSFLGLGVEPGTPDWGRMLAEGRTVIFDNPANALVPGLMIVLTATSMNLLGDWLYERLSERGAAR